MKDLPPDLLKEWDIVLVEDELDSQMVAQIILEYYGANVHVGQNGAEGLEHVYNVRPMFVISDLSMPVMDGWEFIHEMKTSPATQEIPVIALTAHAMTGDRERAISAGFHNYLTKPLTADTFIHDLVKLLVDIPELAEALNI